tara:strand:- start:4751 stop:5560 length:810 start_codon:yes stop_codon:yes gene_type:complete
MELNIHEEIKNKLNIFIKNKKIPHIIFHGEHGSGKRTLLKEFINNIYNKDKELIKTYVIVIDCGHGKGIKFIREELKFFAKANIHNSQELFKSIVLLNADKLTIDAQSALRRCIELFSHTTRFFIIVENKYKLLRPILSRFSEIYVPLPLISGKETALHKYNIKKTFHLSTLHNKKNSFLKNIIKKINKKTEPELLFSVVEKLYNKGISGLDIIDYIEKNIPLSKKKLFLLLFINKIKKEIRNEKTIMYFILLISFIRYNDNLENITFM